MAARLQQRHSLTQNTVAILAGQIGTWLLTASTVALLPRYLGAKDIGVFTIGGTFSTLAATVAGLGMTTLLTKEVARDRDRAAAMLGTAIWVNVFLGLVGALICIMIGAVAGYSHIVVASIVLNAFAIPFVLVSLAVSAVVQGLEVMRWNAIFDVANKALYLAWVGIVVVLDLGIVGLLAGIVALTAFAVLPQIKVARSLLDFRLFAFDRSAARYLVRMSIPFLVMSLSFILYTSTDVLLLSKLADEASVGIYSAPMRVFGTMLFIPVTLSTVMFPRLAAAFQRDHGQMSDSARTTLQISVVTSLALSLGAVSLSDPRIVGALGSSFRDSGPVIVALGVSLAPTSVSIVASRVAFASDRQVAMSWIGAGAFVAKLALGILLIPLFDRWFGNPALGAACGLVAVEFGMTGIMLGFLPEGCFNAAARAFYYRVGAAVAAAIAVLVVLLPVAPFVASVAATITYAALLWGLGVYRIAPSVEFIRGILANRGARPSTLTP